MFSEPCRIKKVFDFSLNTKSSQMNNITDNSKYTFEPDTPKYEKRKLEENPMEYVFKFGKYKGQTIYEIMKTQKGRQYLEWVKNRKTEDGSVSEGLEILKNKIINCFLVYEAYVEKKTKEAKESKEPNAKRAKANKTT